LDVNSVCVCTSLRVFVLGSLVSSASTSKGVPDLSICRHGIATSYSSLYRGFDDRSTVVGTGAENSSLGEESILLQQKGHIYVGE